MLKKLFIIFVLLFLVSAKGMAADKWSTQDVALEITWQVLHSLIDWPQTIHIAKNPRYHEVNPLIGRHPSVAKVNVWFLTTALLHPVITHYLPKEYRLPWQALSLTVSSVCVFHNFLIGIKIDF